MTEGKNDEGKKGEEEQKKEEQNQEQSTGSTGQEGSKKEEQKSAAVTLDKLPQNWQDEVARLRTENAGLRVDKKKAESDAAKVAREAAEEQGKYKELYEAAIAKGEKQDAENAVLKLAALKTQVAEAVKLPAELSARLQGETEDELTADAKVLLASVASKVSGETDGKKGTTGGEGPPEMSDAERDNFAAELGVDPELVKAEDFVLPKKA